MRIISKIENLPNNLKTILLCIIDAIIVFVSYYFAIAFEDITFSLKDPAIQNTLLFIIIMYLVGLNIVGVYKGMVKYSSTKEYLKIAETSLICVALFCTAKEFVKFKTLDTNINILAGLIMAVLSISARVIMRAILLKEVSI